VKVGDMKVLVTGGGTGGHLSPAISFAKFFKEKHNAETFYIGAKKGVERKLLSRHTEGIDHYNFISCQGFYVGRNPFKLLLINLWTLIKLI